jgi:hypothetical protein
VHHTKRALNGRRLTVSKQASIVANVNQRLGDASSALEMGRFEGALKASPILTRNHFSTQGLDQRNQNLALEERGEVE